jgi:2-polyprenyl-3-methyl-5-hydroxy-6-metoxy-1,4-benzoquinol methylase
MECSAVTAYDLESMDPDAVNTSHGLVVQFVGAARRVLDVGCSTGYLGEALTARGCVVDGVDKDPDAVAIAGTRLNSAQVVDLDTDDLAEVLAGHEYDRIIFADVLEHLMNPRAVLASAAALLAPDGEIVISIPNVAHGALRLALLQGRWDYHETGLLDRTHIRFFTRTSLVALIHSAGLSVTAIRSTVVDPLGSEVEIQRTELPQGVLSWVRAQDDSFNYQFVAMARIGVQHGEVPGVEPAIHVAEMDGIEEAAVSVSSLYELRRGFAEMRREIGSLRSLTSSDDAPKVAVPEALEDALRTVQELRRENAELRRSVLNLRDHAIGTEAELGQSRRDRETMRSELTQAVVAITELHASASWRLGRLLVLPLSRARQVLRGAR